MDYDENVHLFYEDSGVKESWKSLACLELRTTVGQSCIRFHDFENKR